KLQTLERNLLKTLLLNRAKNRHRSQVMNELRPFQAKMVLTTSQPTALPTDPGTRTPRMANRTTRHPALLEAVADLVRTAIPTPQLQIRSLTVRIRPAGLPIPVPTSGG